MRDALTPQGYIRQMFRETQDGKFPITYYSFIGEPETITYQVNWLEDDVELIIQKYNLLTFALARIGRLHNQLEDEQSRNKLLSEDELQIWNTYVKPYEPMVVDWEQLYPIPPCEPDELMPLIHEIHERGKFGDLIEEEEKLWKQYCMWREEQSRQRIPFDRRSSANMIERARRYEKLISMNAPEVVVTEEGRCLAEEMVLYCAGKEEPIVWD
jgi:hypothetical protein